jgi:hypothetical protein
MMNPMKWAVWVRIAVVAAIIWEGIVLYNYRQYRLDIWEHPEGYVPIFLF